jgi:hypothetical protein
MTKSDLLMTILFGGLTFSVIAAIICVYFAGAGLLALVPLVFVLCGLIIEWIDIIIDPEN